MGVTDIDIVEEFSHGRDTITANLVVDDESVSTVYLECKGYSGTLDFLQAYDALEDANGNQYTVSDSTKKEILDWAVENGY